jgi:hypothetical protein
MFVEKDTPKKWEARQLAGGMNFLIDNCSTQVGSAEEWNGEELN